MKSAFLRFGRFVWHHRMIEIVYVIMLLFVEPGCSNSRKEAQRAVHDEVKSRESARAESMKLYGYAQKAVESGQDDQAARDLQDAVRIDERNFYAWMLLGQVEYRRDRPYEAALGFDQARRLAPSQYEPLYNMGTVLEEAGKIREAIQAYEDALALEPDALDATENLARAYVRLGERSDRARFLIERALTQERRPEWRRWLGLESVRLSGGPSTRTPATTQASEPPATMPATPSSLFTR